MDDLSVLFFPCYVDGLPRTAASVRFRAEWPAKYWPEADVYPNMSKMITHYDAYVFQKAYLVDFSHSLINMLSRLRNKVLAFDLCDADWLQSAEHERRLLRVLPRFDFAVATTYPIREWLLHWLPAHVIPDRLDLDEFPQQHKQRRGDPSLVWFGYSHNLDQLEVMWSTIERHGLLLTIVSNECPEPWSSRPRLRFVEWTRDGANTEIARHEIALVPQTSVYKSNNRSISAWAMGLAVAKTPDELEAVLSYEKRCEQAETMRQAVHDQYDVRLSVGEWKTLIDSYYEQKQNGGRA